MSCKVSLAAGERTIEGKTLDVSLGGLQAEANGVFPNGTVVAVFLHLGTGAPLRARGTVMRVIGEKQMGIQFVKMDAVDSERLQEFLLPHILKQLDEEPRLRKQS